MIHTHYNITSTHVNKDNPGDSLDIHDVSIKKKKSNIPGWLHINPISTQIDIQSVADQLSDYKFTPGFKVTVDDLLHPKPIDYEAHPANI